MASRLTRDDVLRVAALAHLELTDAEIDLFSGQLADILGFAAEIQKIDTSGIPPTSHVLTTDPGWRDDLPLPSIDRDQALDQAPDAARAAGLFRVPKVL